MMKKVNRTGGIFEQQACRTFLLMALAMTFTIGAILPLTSISYAATPSEATLNADNTTNPPRNDVMNDPKRGTLWNGDRLGGAAPNGEADCTFDAQGNPTSNVCDSFKLTLSGDFTNKRARVQINWNSPTTDYDMYIHKTTFDGPIIATSAAGTTTFEQADIDPAANGGETVYFVRVVYFVAAGDQYRGFATAVTVDPAFVPPTVTLTPGTFNNYKPTQCSPENFATCNSIFPGYNSAGEPSIGVNWNTGNVLFQSNLFTLRTTFNDGTSPATATWVSKQAINQQQSFDPIMFTDSATGRTIPGQLIIAGGASLTAITDNDAETFLPTVASGVTSGVDHQTIGAGPYNRNPIAYVTATNTEAPGTPSVPTTSYPNAWYYASQDVGLATAARSDNGGVSFGTAVPMYNAVQCSGLHGHVKVAPDGTVYVPNKNCPDPDMNAATADGGQGFAVSRDNGLTWRVRTLPGSGSGDNDPAVGIGAGGRVYFAYTSANKHIRAAVSDDRGAIFKYDQDIGINVEIAPGTMGNITASVFPAAVGGDNNRAAIFFLGTGSTDPNDPTGTDGEPTAGMSNGTQDDFKGTWYPYIATTINGGQNWSVVRAGDAVQQGVVCTNGTTCPSGTRNLLDFNDVQVDRQGRVLAGYADGCVTSTCLAFTPNTVTRTSNDKAKVATIIRQVSGPRLFSDFDLNGPAAPLLPPPVEISSTLRGNQLSWLIPDNNGSPLTAYRIYRGYGIQEPDLIGEVGANAQSFRDRKIVKRGSVYYQVTAVNSFGESPRTEKFYVN